MLTFCSILLGLSDTPLSILFVWLFGLWIVVFFFSLNSRVIPPLKKFWRVCRVFGVLLGSYNFLKFSMVLEEKVKNFCNFTVLEVVVDGRRKGTVMSFRVGGRRSKWWSSRTFQGYDQVR